MHLLVHLSFELIGEKNQVILELVILLIHLLIVSECSPNRT